MRPEQGAGPTADRDQVLSQEEGEPPASGLLGQSKHRWISLRGRIVQHRRNAGSEVRRLFSPELRQGSRPSTFIQLSGSIEAVEGSGECQAYSAPKGPGSELLVRPADGVEVPAGGFLPCYYGLLASALLDPDIDDRTGAVQQQSGTGKTAGVEHLACVLGH